MVERAINWIKIGTAPNFQVEWVHQKDCFVSGHAGQLLQVMMNLIQNAYDAALTVTGQLPELRIALLQEGQQAKLYFDDNGPGIAPEHMPVSYTHLDVYKRQGGGRG